MFIKHNKKLNKHKRGFTLAESVLALAVISITSVGTLSLILSAQRSTISAAQKQQAQLYAADIISCYRADGDFSQNVQFALGKPIEENTVTLDGNLTAYIQEENNSTLTVAVKNEKDKVLTTLSFTKGGDTP